MTTPISEAVKKTVKALRDCINWPDRFRDEDEAAKIIQLLLAAETAELRIQLHACVQASKDIHKAQAETIDQLRTQLSTLATVTAERDAAVSA